MPDNLGNLLPNEPPKPPGLMNIQTPLMGTTTTYTPERATGTGYDPATFNVTPEQTTQEQIKKIVAADSPLMRQAEQKAMQRMNRRGLLNSTLSTTAGQEAVIGAALPIANADAAAYERAATNTSQADNLARQFKAGAENTASLMNAGEANKAMGFSTDATLRSQLATLQADTTLSQTDKQTKSNELISAGDNTTKTLLQTMQNTTELTKAQLSVDTQLAITKIDNQTKTAIATLDAQNRQLLQSNVNAANMYQETVKNIAAIAVNDTMTPEAKATATQSQLNALNEGLKVTAGIASTDQTAVKNLNLSQYFLNVA